MIKTRFGLPLNLQLFAADTGAEGGGNDEGDKGAEHTIPKSRFDEVNGKFKDVQKQLDDLLKAKADADKAKADKETEDAAKKGEFESLYTKTKADADKLKGDARVAGERVTSLEAVINGLLETKLATIPEDFRDLVPSNLTPEAKLAWVDAAEAKGLFGAKEQKPLGSATNPGNTQTVDVNSLDPMQMFQAGYGKK